MKVLRVGTLATILDPVAEHFGIGRIALVGPAPNGYPIARAIANTPCTTPVASR